MEKICKLCGEVLPEGVDELQHHAFKKMCLNCAFAQSGDDPETYLCGNEDNKKLVEKKMLEAAQTVSEAYKVNSLNIAPLPLKKVTGKCKQWVLSDEVLKTLPNLFN